jgi:hypothetical protein
MKNVIQKAIDLGKELEKQQEKALQLWTWLPSYEAAKKYHDDYSDVHMPSVADILTEASIFISHKLTPTEEQKKEVGEWYECPCGEFHEQKISQNS